MVFQKGHDVQAISTAHLHHLDLLRGIAALCVVLGHRRPWFDDNLLPHFFLAVDFFFILSGFVIDRAYRSKIGSSMTMQTFIAVRLIRLYPLIALSVILGLVVALARVATEGGSYWDPFVSAGAHFLLIPGVGSAVYPYPLNDPMWSLFFELVANIAFLFLAPKLSTRVLASIVIVAALGLIWVTFQSGSVAQGHLMARFEGGFARVGFGFFAGCLLNRLSYFGRRHIGRIRAELWVPLVLIGVLQVPRTSFDPWFELVAVILVFPVLIFIGAQAKSIWPKVEAIGGELSYPLYVLHIPLLFLLAGGLRAMGLSDANPSPVEGAIRILIVCLFAWLSYIIFDKPARRRLTSRIRP